MPTKKDNLECSCDCHCHRPAGHRCYVGCFGKAKKGINPCGHCNQEPEYTSCPTGKHHLDPKDDVCQDPKSECCGADIQKDGDEPYYCLKCKNWIETPSNLSLQESEERILQETPWYSITRSGSIKNIITGEAKHPTNVGGYLRVLLAGNGKPKNRYVHRLVALTFLPNPKNKPQVNHKNGNCLDNRVENLYWGTQKENQADSRNHGTLIKGEKAGNSKLNEEKARRIRFMKLQNPLLTTYEIAKSFDVTASCVQRILRGKTWKHL